jgi:alpha-ketoglutarate-dependent taurine dioxygenase
MFKSLKHHFIQSVGGSGKIACYEPHLPNIDLHHLINIHKQEIEDILIAHGGILFRGFGIEAVSKFELIANIFAPNLLDYHFRSTPRTKVEGKIYTSTEYPANRFIQFHNECSYTNSWPNKILFFCVTPSTKGGETALADSRHVYAKIDKNIRDRFERNGLTYVRNYIPGLDMSWKDVFQTTQRSEVEKYCQEADIHYEWKSGLVELTTRQKTQAAIAHHTTGEKVWFNQAHLYHASALQANEKSALLNFVGAAENLPRNVMTGDNKAIEDEHFKNIRDAYESERIEFQWQEADLLLLDNILMAHSRNQYEGNRKIVVAMG